MSSSQSAQGQAARWKIPLRARPIILHNPLRLFINFLEWISSNDAANRGLGTLTSLISVCAVVFGVYQYFITSSQRELQTQVGIWQGITYNSGEGQKAAVQLLAEQGFPMDSIHLRGADLSTVNFAKANLSYSDIEDSNLSNADLTSVQFVGATISNDDFSYANLTGVDLSRLSRNAAAHSDNFSGAVMPGDVDLKTLSALTAFACIGMDDKGKVLWPVQNGNTLTNWPVNAQGKPQMCTPPKIWQASCASPWCSHATAKKRWYNFSFLLQPLTSAMATANAATPLPAASSQIKSRPASAPTQKPPPPTTTRQSSQAMAPPM